MVNKGEYKSIILPLVAWYRTKSAMT